MTITWLGIVALVLLGLSCYAGYRRGLIRELVSMFCVILSIVIVWFINPYVNQFLRDNTGIYDTVQESCSKFVEGKSNESEKEDGEEQNDVIKNLNLPSLLTNGISENNTADVYSYLSADTFSEYLAHYLAEIVINGLSFLVSFILSTLLIRCITWAADLITRIPVIKGVNKIAGALFGLIKFVVIIWILFLILTVLCNTAIGQNGLKLIRQDQLLNYLYNKDILIRIFLNVFYMK
ncbi:MAG: CvpA family protein [Blautia sp.]|nr:CvpA family protein [Clostridia bacterium]MDY4692670.1 CvpA family protein [Blautia sp.]MDY5554981.1 CvpA family protein [Blautia sp.]